MLEAFKLIEPKRPRPAETTPAPHLAWPAPELAQEPPEGEPAEEIPFIEVGGPRSTLVASPAVLASAPAAGSKTPPSHQPSQGIGDGRVRHVPVPVPLPLPDMRSISGTGTGTQSAPEIMTVVFRPLPAEPTVEPALRRFAPELIAYHRSEHPVSEQYRVLTTAISAQLPAARAQVLLFTAVTPEAGTTTVLLNAAITYARQGRLRVAVIDANLRRPALARRLGLPEAPGLRDFLAGKVSLGQALRETGQPNLLALTVGDTGTIASGRHLGESLRRVLGQLRERFDLVLVDAPCWDGRPELVALGTACDAVYLVLPEREANAPEAQDLIRMIPQHGGRLRGCILTQR
jgi:Mrp family chromosome partitioning ATPase